MRLSSSNQSLPEAFKASSRGWPPKRELLASEVDSPTGVSRFFSCNFGRFTSSSAEASRNSSFFAVLCVLCVRIRRICDVRERTPRLLFDVLHIHRFAKRWKNPRVSVFLSAPSDRFCNSPEPERVVSIVLSDARSDQSPVSATRSQPFARSVSSSSIFLDPRIADPHRRGL